MALREQIDATKQLGELRSWAVEVEQERLERREKEDSDALFKLGSERVADIDHLPADHAERWLRAEYTIDPELHAAWDNRYESPEAMRWCQNCVRHALARLREAAKKMPDPRRDSGPRHDRRRRYARRQRDTAAREPAGLQPHER